MIERTLVLIKPDGVQRAIVGRIISRFEDAGLKLAAMRMVWADEKLAKEHYPLDEEWAKKMFDKTNAAYVKEGKKMPYKDYKEMGKLIQGKLMDFIKEGPVVAMVLEAPHAVELVRKLIGSTEPRSSVPGTIRADFASIESYAYSDSAGRACRNLIHASDSVDNAKREISLWFPPKEIHSYRTIHDFVCKR